MGTREREKERERESRGRGKNGERKTEREERGGSKRKKIRYFSCADVVSWGSALLCPTLIREGGTH